MPILFCIFIALACHAFSAETTADPNRIKALETITSMGYGFIVWESNRTGNWRIYRIELDGTGLRQISPDEKGREHFCPHLSPDGKKLVYLSYPTGSDTYNKRPSGLITPMHIMSSDGTSDRILIANARAYGEDRAVLWVDNDTFHYIDGNGIACEYSISQNKSAPLAASGGLEGCGWLVNAQKTYATTGWPAAFNRYDPKTQKVSAAAELGGCQPYFSSDGVWGFWMGNAGGPINRINLATGKISPILGNKDGRMPPDRNYLYFPMLSHNRRLFTFGASPGQHDHFKSDYDIFVAPVDPQTLELTGNPVRYTFDPGCDRFPDVYIADLDLGISNGEAPFTVKFTPKGAAQAWTWSFGDGSSATGSTISHKYSKPGNYAVEAKLGDRTIHGRVLVEPAKSPEALSASLRSDKEILVTFSEPVNLSKAKFVISGKQKIPQFTLAQDRLSATLHLAKSVSKGDQLRIEGISDLAQAPNKMPVKLMGIRTYAWPSNRQNLVVLWENGKTGCVTGSGERCAVQAIGRATLDNRYCMRTAGGNYNISGADGRILEACKKSNQLAIELTIETDSLDQTGPARIITLSSSPYSRNFTIGQEKDQLVFRLRTPETGENGVNPETKLCQISAGKPVHLIVSYQPGELTCYVNGKQILKTDQVKGDFSNWTAHHLLIGDEWQGQRSWRGALEGIAIYNRTITAAEASREFDSYIALHPKNNISPLMITAKLISTSPLPTLTQIKPYREALALREYKVEKVLQGKCKAQKIRVEQWAILGGEELAKPGPAPNTTSTLTLTPLEQNPQLSSTYVSDTLDPDPDIPVYYDIAM